MTRTECDVACEEPTHERLVQIFHDLVYKGTIRHGRTDIWNAGMSIVDFPSLAVFVPEIVADLCRSIRQSGVVFDAFADCPSGGTAWAEALAVRTSTALGRDIPLMRLKKQGACSFAVPPNPGIAKGSRILVVDDTLHEGHTSRAAADALRCAGYRAIGVVTPVVIEAMGRNRWHWDKLPVFSTFNSEFVAALRK